MVELRRGPGWGRAAEQGRASSMSARRRNERAGRQGVLGKGTQATDAHTTLRPASRVVVVVVTRFLTRKANNGPARPASTRPPVSAGSAGAPSSFPAALARG